MTPTPQDPVPPQETSVLDGERVVITGMSGLFPESRSVKQLSEILYSKKNPVNDERIRWKYNHPEVANHTGKVPGLDRFDAQFFKVHYRLGNSMDSMGRKILEQAYQAIYDAGISPEYLNGKKVGVYVGSCFSETEKACFYVASSRTGFGIAGCSKTMFANRVSYWMNAKGPSMSIDEACCSSIAALEQAYMAIARGECEAAIVGGANLCLHPQSSVHYGRIMKICMDGKTKSFDQNADGCAKSEAINVLFLQKAKYAKRIYAEVLHVKTEFNEILEGETGPKYGFYRDPLNLAEFINRFYEEANVPPQAIEYVEAFGSAVPEADKAELEAIEDVFCKNRKDPLLVGSVMSNIGYGEAASGINAITKVLLGYHNGELAGNLHCENPRQDIAALRDGRMEILTDHKSFGRTFAAVNGISVTGVNAHVLLNGLYKPKDLNRYKTDMPHLVTLSGRQDSAVKKILEDLKSRPIDPEEVALFHNIHKTVVSGHLGRGYTILATNENKETVSLSEQSNYFDGAKRPLWFVYSGMGSQWAGMGTQLMKIPIFAAAIERCCKALEPKGVDLMHILTSPDKTVYDNILHSFVGIAAVQIGLTDILTAVGLVPDKIIGHSVGELGCAYADGCFTPEEMILAAYHRGLVSLETPFIKGSMAAVGLGYQQICKMLPPEIEVACHNGPESSTISGPADIMREFVAKLTAQGVFAKEVPCSNIAYHSRYIAEAGPALLKYLGEVIKDPKPRTERWVSSSVPQEEWGAERAKHSSAEYHTNNLLSPVLFEETSRLIPADAVLVEIAPHGLLQAILKRSLPESCKNIPLTRRGHSDNTFMVLDGIGKLYMEGYYPDVAALYPQVEFPVSTGTPMLSHLVEWAHNEIWNLPLFVSAHRRQAAATKYPISIHDEEYNYLEGNVIRGKIMYPFSAAFVIVWDTLAMSLKDMNRKEMPVEFSDVHLYAQPTLHDRRQLRLSVSLHRGTGRFEVLDDDRKVITGFVSNKLSEIQRIFNEPFESKEDLDFTSEEIYQTLYERDYSYSGDFKSLVRANQSLTQAQIVWNDNWETFLDGLLQLNVLRNYHETVSQPFQIRKICIDPEIHAKTEVTEVNGTPVLTAQFLELQNMTRSGGVLIDTVQHRKLPLLEEDPLSMKILKFVPHYQNNSDIKTILQVYLQMVAENNNKHIINVLGVQNNKEELSIFNVVKNIIDDIPGVTVQYEQMRREKVLVMRDYFLTDVDLVLTQNLSSDDNLCQLLYRVLRRNTFIINGEEMIDDRIRPSALYKIVSTQVSKNVKLDFIRWRPTQQAVPSSIVTVKSRADLALLASSRSNLQQRQKLIILSTYPSVLGLKDLVQQWRNESERNQIYLVQISEKDNLEQLPDLDLAYSVLNDGIWGGEYYVSLNDKVTVDRGVTLKSSRIGDLESMYWVEAVEPTGPGVAVTVHYAALNDNDVKRAIGDIPFKNDEISYGMDFSGVTDSGQRVMGILPSGAVSGRVRARPELLWPVPDHWSLEDAATVPSAYFFAYYCYNMKVQFRRGYKVLVHGGAGALGQAAIAVALAHGCEVFATVSDIRKKKFLLGLFPELKENHIGNSRDSSFGDMVQIVTKGEGCDVVLNCLKGELKNVSYNCVAISGMVVDLVQIPTQEDFNFGMYALSRERHYVFVDFMSLFENGKLDDIKKLQVLVSEGIARGDVRPLSRMTLPPREATRAFRLLAGSRHRGRVLLKMRDTLHLAEPRLYCSPDLTHLVVCDNKPLGLQLAERLVARGAKKLAIQYNSPPATIRPKTLSWEKSGVKVQVTSEDLATSKGIIRLLHGSNRLGPIEGIYFVATNADGDTIEDVNYIVSNLDLAARKLCPSLKYFAVVGNTLVGQQACLSRNQSGLPGTLITLPHGNSSNVGELSWRNTVNAIERGIRSSQNIVFAHPAKSFQPTLLQQIAVIAGLKLQEDISETATLLELGIEVAKAPVLSNYLRDMHSLALSENDVLELSVKKIRELERNLKEIKFKDENGLFNFFSYVDPDELLATCEYACLPTRANDSTMRDEEFDVNQIYLCVIPGLEGHHDRFKELCERLKLPAVILQPGLDHLQETFKQTAERYAKVLLNRAGIKNNFYLLGYEAGILIALELVAILEKLGLTGTLFCVGGTPEEVKATIEDKLVEYKTEEQLQDEVVRHMFSLMTGNTEGIDNVLKKFSSWREKIEGAVRLLLGQVPHSAQYARALIEGAYSRITQAKLCKTYPSQLRSKIIILRAASVRSIVDAVPVSSYSQQPVVEYQLKEALAHSAFDLRCTAIINKHLGDHILEEFDKRNLCESYLINSDTFMAPSDLDLM